MDRRKFSTKSLVPDYHCNGAACGAWWKGKFQEFEPTYAVLDFSAMERLIQN